MQYMKHATITSIPTKQLSIYFQRAADLADFFEDLLEDRGSVQPLFLRGLRRAHHEAARGTTRKVHSLTDLH